MHERRRILFLTLIMLAVAVGVAAIAISALYEVGFEQQRARLVETAQSHARLIEAVARFDARYSTEHVFGSAFADTLEQIRDAQARFKGFGKTGEFTMAKREGDWIVFLLSHRHLDLDNPKPVPFSSEFAEPMRRALTGESGSMVGLDYRGETVLAAYEPVAELDLGIVAKIGDRSAAVPAPPRGKDFLNTVIPRLHAIEWSPSLILVFCLILISLNKYLLFHTLAEFFAEITGLTMSWLRSVLGDSDFEEIELKGVTWEI